MTIICTFVSMKYDLLLGFLLNIFRVNYIYCLCYSLIFHILDYILHFLGTLKHLSEAYTSVTDQICHDTSSTILVKGIANPRVNTYSEIVRETSFEMFNWQYCLLLVLNFAYITIRV
jgi:hypothetical protein